MADGKNGPAAADKTAVKRKLGVKQMIIILLICPVIVIAMSSAAIIYTVHHLEPEETVENVDPLAGTVLPDGLDMPLSLFCAQIADKTAQADNIKAGTDAGVSFHDFSGDFPESAFSLINHVGGQINDRAKGKYETKSVGYGESCAKLLNISTFAKQAAEESGEYNEGSRKYRYTFDIPTDAKCLIPFCEEDGAMFAGCKEDCAAYADITDSKHELKSVTAYYEYDSVNGHLTYFELVREYAVSMNAAFKNHLDVFGSGVLNFGCTVSTRCNITHAGVFIGEDELKLTKHGFQTLSVSANVADDAAEGEDFTIEFFSSDETVAKADANGMVEAVSVSDTPVTVTAKLTYLGKVYEDSCTVYVIDED